MTNHFHFPVTTLVYNGNLIVGATVAHPALAPRLSATIVTDTVALLAKISTDITTQKTKRGSLGNLTAAQKTSFLKLENWMSKARHTASLAFKGHTVQLHEQFQVGIHEPNDLESILTRADIILTNLQLAANLPALLAKGWTAADTAAFVVVRAVFPASSLTQQAARSDAMDATTVKNSDANVTYDNLLAIQNAADLQWPPEDPANHGIRADFRLDVFPPIRHNHLTTPPAPPVPPPQP